MSDTYTLDGLTAEDLVLLRSALDLEAVRHAETQRSIRHTKRCTTHEGIQRYPAFRLAAASAQRCAELRAKVLGLLEPPG